MNIRLIKEQTLRLFQQMHQNDLYYDYWRRGSGSSICKICGLKYRDHLNAEEYPLGTGAYETYYDKRLCNGDIIHL